MTTQVAIIIFVLVLVVVGVIALYLDNRKKINQMEEPMEEPTELKPEPGKWYLCIKDGVFGGYPDGDTHFLKGEAYYCDNLGMVDHNTEHNFHEDFKDENFEEYFKLWTIEDAEAGDVLANSNISVFIYAEVLYNKPYAYCGVDKFGVFKDNCRKNDWSNSVDDIHPATKEQRDLLFQKMKEAGYEWNPDTLTLSKVEEEPQTEVQNGDPAVIAPVEDKKPKEEEPEPPVKNDVPVIHDVFNELVVYFNNVVTIYEGGYTYNYLLNLCNYAFDSNSDVIVNLRKNFPCVLDFYTNIEYGFALEKTCAWIFALVLVELVPEKRDAIYEMAYNYKETGSDVPTFGWSLKSDPNVGRMCAFAIVNTFYDLETMNDLRCEVGGKMLTYKNDISETFIGIAKFLPPAPEPYVKGCENRKDTRYPCGIMYNEDAETHKYVSRYYSLETKDSEKLAATIEAIGNKEHHKEHLFGKPRTVNHPTLGTITIYPVFGKHNIGIEIPENGAIANLCYEVGKASSNNRQSQLEIEYGRRRPCMGEYDGTANPNPSERALVDFYIEDGDGHRTGYYEKNGDWVDDNGNHIGDFTTFYQNAVYANSYTSGHSAFIEGAAGVLMRIMPDKALEIEYAKNTFANGRVICRYHWVSDTMVGRIVGTMMLPVMFATTNCDMKNKYRKALEEYDALINGSYNPEPVTDKVNASLSYVCGGYGSCHVDAGEASLNHYCNKECDRERHPSIQVSQDVDFTIEGGDVTDINGKTSGTWEANTNYELVCPAVGENEEKVAVITMRNENGVRVLNYKLSRKVTKDEGAGK